MIPKQLVGNGTDEDPLRTIGVGASYYSGTQHLQKVFYQGEDGKFYHKYEIKKGPANCCLFSHFPLSDFTKQVIENFVIQERDRCAHAVKMFMSDDCYDAVEYYRKLKQILKIIRGE